jgi:hypothetical protein
MAAPLCRHCGGRIAKAVRTHPIAEGGAATKDTGLHSKADCQRITNSEITSISYFTETKNGEPTGHRWIVAFNTWDGSSYVDDFFCSGSHAQAFGRLMAKQGHRTRAYDLACARRTPQTD